MMFLKARSSTGPQRPHPGRKGAHVRRSLKIKKSWQQTLVSFATMRRANSYSELINILIILNRHRMLPSCRLYIEHRPSFRRQNVNNFINTLKSKPHLPSPDYWSDFPCVCFFKLFFWDTETSPYLVSSVERRELFLKFEICTLRARRGTKEINLNFR